MHYNSLIITYLKIIVHFSMLIELPIGGSIQYITAQQIIDVYILELINYAPHELPLNAVVVW